METHWSKERNILLVTMTDENLISSIFRRQAEIGRERIRLLKYIFGEVILKKSLI